jgi:hypothetical protein
MNFIILLFIIFYILAFYFTILDIKILTILNKNNIKANYFNTFFSYNLFLEFIKSNKVEDSLRGKYIRLYKKAIWTKRLCLLLLLSLFILMPLLSALKLW